MTRKEFSDTGADACIKAWRDTQEIAKLKDMTTALETPKPFTSSSLPVPPATVFVQAPTPWSGPDPIKPIEDVTTFRWPLSKGVVAEVRFVGPAKPAHLELLKRYLDVAKDSMEADTGTQETNPPQKEDQQ